MLAYCIKSGLLNNLSSDRIFFASSILNSFKSTKGNACFISISVINLCTSSCVVSVLVWLVSAVLTCEDEGFSLSAFDLTVSASFTDRTNCSKFASVIFIPDFFKCSFAPSVSPSKILACAVVITPC